MKFEFISGSGEPRAVCRDVGKIEDAEAFLEGESAYLFFRADGKRYRAHAKPSYARFTGGVPFECVESGGDFELSEPPKRGVLDDWRTPSGAMCSDPRVVSELILGAAALLLIDRGNEEKGAARIAEIIADVPTRAEALEWLKKNRFPSEWNGGSCDVDDRLKKGEEREDFAAYLRNPCRLVKRRIRPKQSPR